MCIRDRPGPDHLGGWRIPGLDAAGCRVAVHASRRWRHARLAGHAERQGRARPRAVADQMCIRDRRFSAHFRMPNLEHRAYLFVGRDDLRSTIREKPEALSAQQRLLAAKPEERSFLAGLGLTLPNGVDVRLGLGARLKPYVQARYTRLWAWGPGQSADFRETIFWSQDERLGSTTALTYQIALRQDLALRWLGTATITQTSRNFEWSSSLGAYQSVSYTHLAWTSPTWLNFVCMCGKRQTDPPAHAKLKIRFTQGPAACTDMQGRRLDHARSNDSPAIKAPCPAEQHLPCASHARRPAHRGAGLSGGALRSPAVPVRQRGHGRPRTKVDPCFRPVGAGDRSVGETHPGATSPATVMQAWHRGSRRGGVSSRGVRPSVHGLMWAPGQDLSLIHI